MNNLKKLILPLAFILIGSSFTQAQEYQVESFNKIIVSPFIDVVLRQSDKELVTIEDISVDESKFNIEVKGKTLRVYLDDAKEIPKQKTVMINGHKTKQSLYNDAVVKVIIDFRDIDDISFRGEESLVCETPLAAKSLDLKVYGASTLDFLSLDLQLFDVVIYGEAELNVEQGKVARQELTAYGESIFNLERVETEETKIVAHGEAHYKVNAKYEIKATCYGDAVIEYSGDAKIKKGLFLGEVTLNKVDFK